MNNNCNNPCQIINVLGPQGPQGAQGEVGPQGPQGAQGIPGLPNTNNFVSLQAYNQNIAFANSSTFNTVVYQQIAAENGNTIEAFPLTGEVTLAAGHTYFIMVSLDGTSFGANGVQYSYQILINGNPMPPTGTLWQSDTLNINVSFILTTTTDTTIEVGIRHNNNAANGFLRGAFLNVVQLI